MYIISVNKSQELLLNVRWLYYIFSRTTPPSSHRRIVFFNDDTMDSTSTSWSFFDDVVHYCTVRTISW